MEVSTSSLNFFDILVLSVVGFSTLIAFVRGFFKTVFSFVGFLVSSSGVYFLYHPVSRLLQPYIHSELALLLVSVIGLFLFLLVMVSFVNAQILGMLSPYRFGFLDRTLGFAVGFGRGMLIVCVAFYTLHSAAVLMNPSVEKNAEGVEPEWLRQAQTYTLLSQATEFGLSFLPADSSTQVASLIDYARNSLSKTSAQTSIVSRFPKHLDGQEQSTLKRVISAVPQREVDEIYRDRSGEGPLEERERINIFREIIANYRELQLRGQIAEADVVDEAMLARLEASLNMRDEDGSLNVPALSSSEKVGRTSRDAESLDRLIDAVSPSSDQ